MPTLPTCLLTCLVAAAAAADAAPAAGGLQHPESVAQDPDTGAIYCSNIGAGGDDAPLAKDGNGFIAKLNPDGSVAELKFLPKEGDEPLNAPKGMVIYGGALWVADIDRVVGYNLDDGKQLQSFDLAEQKVTFANDLAEAGGVLLLSDTLGDQVLMLEGATRGQLVKAEATGKGLFPGANGIAVATDGKVLVANFPIKDMANGKGWIRRYTLGADLSKNERLPFPDGLWDGIAIGADGTVYATDWRSGGVWSVAPGAKEAKQLSKDMKGPADLCLLGDGSGLLVPEMMADKVTLVPVK